MNLPIHELVNNISFFAQVVEDPDIIGQISDAWQNFIETGQIWAMLIGMFLGYVFASFTKFQPIIIHY